MIQTGTIAAVAIAFANFAGVLTERVSPTTYIVRPIVVPGWLADQICAMWQCPSRRDRVMDQLYDVTGPGERPRSLYIYRHSLGPLPPDSPG